MFGCSLRISFTSIKRSGVVQFIRRLNLHTAARHSSVSGFVP